MTEKERIVAAWPEVIAAAREVLEWETYMGGWESPCFDRLRAALATATGEEDPNPWT